MHPTHFSKVESSRGNNFSQFFMETISDRWSVYPLEKKSQNGTALQYYSRQVGVPPVLNKDDVKHEVGGNGKITVEETVLNKPPQNPIFHGKILQIQRLENSYQRSYQSYQALITC